MKCKIVPPLVERNLVIPSAGSGEPSRQVEAEGQRRPRPRIESLAYLIFGLSLAIDSIALLPTAAATPEQMNSRILIFAFAFLFLITAWLIYTTYMSVLPVDTLTVTFLNVALLLLVALIPYLLNNVVLGDSPSLQDYSSSLFALDLTGILVILAIFAHALSREGKARWRLRSLTCSVTAGTAWPSSPS